MGQSLHYKFGFTFDELLTSKGLHRLDGEFQHFLKLHEKDLQKKLHDYRHADHTYTAIELSEFLIKLAPLLEDFLIDFFSIDQEIPALAASLDDEAVVQAFKKRYVLRLARRYRKEIQATFAELDAWLDEQLEKTASHGEDKELATAHMAMSWQQDETKHAAEIERMVQWCALSLKDPQARQPLANWDSFNLPQLMNLDDLVTLHDVPDDSFGRKQGDPAQFRQRYGFELTDARMNRRESEGQVHYCIYCHDHDGDFCSKGFPVKKAEPQLGIKVNSQGEYLTGCPLDEKISEMHLLRKQNKTIAALAVAMVDNPMVPATGHRICNDCMKACIYQKQDPVNIPQIETRVLTDVLSLPWGVEIYDLLTRWNPLRQTHYLMNDYNGFNVLIAGLGPAGFTMAHYLTMEGCGVVGIDGLKIEPIPDEWLEAPIRSYEKIKDGLDERILMGFGGVAEYGITVRWDKNFLKLIYLTIARRMTFQCFGGVRFGGTISIENAWQLGFDHICLANGAGYPRVLDFKNSMARGMRQANDFLMALQLTGAAKDSSLANLQVRLPAVVIGSGLTAIDTATEVQAYYIKQIEKIHHRYHTLRDAESEEQVLQGLDEENREILQEYLRHAEQWLEEKRHAHQANRPVETVRLIRDWGGVTVVYRRHIKESPAYKRNHEEINKALEEGIYYLEGVEPLQARLDKYQHVEALVCKSLEDNPSKEIVLPARAVFVAAGARPNTIYENEHPGHMQLQENHYQPFNNNAKLTPAENLAHNKLEGFGPFTSYDQQKRKISFIGDAHPVFHGSVVKAIASAKKSSPEVMTALQQLKQTPRSMQDYLGFQKNIYQQLTTVLHSINEYDNIIELWVKAPLAAQNFQPGQFFRFQAFESSSQIIEGTRMQLPLQTISGAGVKDDKIRLLLLRMGANAKLIEHIQPGDPVVLMGPAGAPSDLPSNKTVLVIAGSWGAAVMLNLGPALRAKGNKIIYLAAYRREDELYFKQELQQVADQMIWVCSTDPGITTERPQDLSYVEPDLIQLLKISAVSNKDGEGVPLEDVDEVLVMGSTGLLSALQKSFKKELKSLFRKNPKIVGTVGSPMQCMLKGVCAQCLQWQIDSESGQRTRTVFTCAMQDQPLEVIDLENLSARQKQNKLSEYLTAQWVNHVQDAPED